MRIVAWNCNMALHSKLLALKSLGADIAVVPECANLGILSQKAPDLGYVSGEWVGRHGHKGLGVFSFGPWTLHRYSAYDESLEFAIPLLVDGPVRFHLLAVWACHPKKRGPASQYLGPAREAVARYREFLRAAPSVVAGDFNNNVIWDRPGSACNHSELVKDLEGVGLESAYHGFTGASAGDEPDPTIFWTRNAAKTYHIDYCFIPKVWRPRLKGVSVGTPQEWLPVSDHAPVSVEVDIEAVQAAEVVGNRSKSPSVNNA